MSAFSATPHRQGVLHCQRDSDDGENLQEGLGGDQPGKTHIFKNLSLLILYRGQGGFDYTKFEVINSPTKPALPYLYGLH